MYSLKQNFPIELAEKEFEIIISFIISMETQQCEDLLLLKLHVSLFQASKIGPLSYHVLMFS